MEKIGALAALAALAQDNRLDVFRLLVQAGPEGMPAGEVASRLDLAPNTLKFTRSSGVCLGRNFASGERRTIAQSHI